MEKVHRGRTHRRRGRSLPATPGDAAAAEEELIPAPADHARSQRGLPVLAGAGPMGTTAREPMERGESAEEAEELGEEARPDQQRCRICAGEASAAAAAARIFGEEGRKRNLQRSIQKYLHIAVRPTQILAFPTIEPNRFRLGGRSASRAFQKAPLATRAHGTDSNDRDRARRAARSGFEIRPLRSRPLPSGARPLGKSPRQKRLLLEPRHARARTMECITLALAPRRKLVCGARQSGGSNGRERRGRAGGRRAFGGSAKSRASRGASGSCKSVKN